MASISARRERPHCGHVKIYVYIELLPTRLGLKNAQSGAVAVLAHSLSPALETRCNLRAREASSLALVVLAVTKA